MLSAHTGVRSAVFVEVDRVEAPGAPRRRPGITPGPVIQFGTFNINAVENEVEMNTWYSRSRLPLVKPLEGNVGARRLVSIAGWPKHGILYEFESLDAAQNNLQDTSEWTRKVIGNLGARAPLADAGHARLAAVRRLGLSLPARPTLSLEFSPRCGYSTIAP